MTWKRWRAKDVRFVLSVVGTGWNLGEQGWRPCNDCGVRRGHGTHWPLSVRRQLKVALIDSKVYHYVREETELNGEMGGRTACGRYFTRAKLTVG